MQNITGTSRWSNADDFAVAMKAAAWSAQHLMALRGKGGSPMECVHQAAYESGIADPEKPVANCDSKIIWSAIYELAFSQSNATRVEQLLGQAWREYAGMGTKARDDEADHGGPDYIFVAGADGENEAKATR